MADVIQATCLLIFTLLLHQAEQKVFLSSENANKVIHRSKRANFILLEEIRKGDLERECLEELCSYEEARETFEDKEKTDRFWKTYHGGRQCTSCPCLNKGECTDTIRSYTCSCPEGYYGRNCEFANNECHPNMNDGCQHFCHPNYGFHSFFCSCAEGYTLGGDERSCNPTGKFTNYSNGTTKSPSNAPGRRLVDNYVGSWNLCLHLSLADPYACGQAVDNEDYVENEHLPNNRTRIFPWEVILLNSDSDQFCSGIILKPSLILTTAKCSNLHNPIYVFAGTQKGAFEKGKQIIKVKDHSIHMRYLEKTGDNDIALLKLQSNIEFDNYTLPICIPQKDFAENVLIHSNNSIVSGWTQGSDLDLAPFEFPATYSEKENCESALNVTQTNRMFCGVSQNVVDSPMVDGSYFAVEHKGTWFLTGIMGSKNSALSNQNVFSFTKISRYIMWLKQTEGQFH
ncbi:vitamin K-dependent protein Z [Spea bombifrons]|uniref:vitamin K-dependent protein Z n=1 Tax=Spea bombifrons TaxID=233779 RepID=UPI002348F2DE|nr:vitamin K-dependent protein Z [Spea bombifrons]